MQVELERQTRKVINHTAKRVMSNAAQTCELAMKMLDEE